MKVMQNKLLLSLGASILLMLTTFSANLLAAKYVLKAAHSANANEPYHIGLEYFADEVKKRTGGEVEIKIYPNNQLGNEKQMIEGILLGTIDITVPSNGVLTNFVKDLSIFDLPFLFKSREHMYKVMDGKVGVALSKKMEAKGFKLLSFYEAGVRHIMTTKKPINSLADLEGLKIRTMNVPAHVAAFNSYRAKATPLAYAELYGALQAGVVDGAEAANTNYNSKKFYEVAPYWAQIGWTALIADLIISKKKFDSLPAKIQKIFMEVAKESATLERKTYSDSDNSLLESLKKNGVKITYPDPAEFRKASESVYKEFADTKEKKKLLQMILDTK